MKRPLEYTDGLGTGIAVLGLVAIAWLANLSGSLEQMYGQIGNAKLPSLTQLVMSTAWRVVVPAVLVGALVAAHVWRPRYALVGVAAATLGVAGFWYWAAYQPIYAIAGNIR